MSEEISDKSKTLHNHIVTRTDFYNRVATIRSNLLKALPVLEGNGSYGGMKTTDDYAYAAQYVCKGTGPDWDTQGPKIICTDVSEDLIREYHKAYWQIKAGEIKAAESGQIRVDLQPVIKQRARTKQWNERLSDKIQEEFPHKLWNMDDEDDLNYLTRRFYKEMGKTARNLDNTIYNRMLSGLYASLPKDYAAEETDLNIYREGYRRWRGNRS